jgi:hypothetical protein
LFITFPQSFLHNGLGVRGSYRLLWHGNDYWQDARENYDQVAAQLSSVIKDSGWLKEECDQFLEESIYPLPFTYSYQWAYNAGLAGGSRNLMYFFTAEMTKLIFKTTSNYHKDMTLLNIVIHENFYPCLSIVNWNQQLVDTKHDSLASHQKLITGFPFNSGFKMLDLKSKALFIHK